MKPSRIAKTSTISLFAARHSEYFAPHILEAVKWEQKRLHERWAHLLTPNMDALSVHGQVRGY